MLSSFCSFFSLSLGLFIHSSILHGSVFLNNSFHYSNFNRDFGLSIEMEEDTTWDSFGGIPLFILYFFLSCFLSLSLFLSFLSLTHLFLSFVHSFRYFTKDVFL